MNLKKSLLSTAVAATMTAAIVGPAQADVINMDYVGLFTMLDPGGVALQNTSYPYYGDTTWSYGYRTQISGTMTFDTVTGAGSGTVEPFEFFNKGPAAAQGVEFQSIGGGLMLGNMKFNWNGASIATQIVLDGSGLFAAIGAGVSVGDVYDQAWCGTTVGAPCSLPASDGAKKGSIPIGPVPVATSTLNVQGSWGDWDNDPTTGDSFQNITGLGADTTLAALLSYGYVAGTDDGIGGSPMDNGPFAGFNANFDMTSVTITPTVPVPAAVWLFGSGLLGLVGVARRRKQA